MASAAAASSSDGAAAAAAGVWASQASAAQFCPRCGTLLSLQPLAPPAGTGAACGACGWAQPLSALPRLLAATVTRAAAKPEHEWLVEARAAAADPSGADARGAARPAHARATVAEECPNPACRAPTMRFYTMQLRSADEGQTCFYDCEKCGHKFSVNT